MHTSKEDSEMVIIPVFPSGGQKRAHDSDHLDCDKETSHDHELQFSDFSPCHHWFMI